MQVPTTQFLIKSIKEKVKRLKNKGSGFGFIKLKPANWFAYIFNQNVSLVITLKQKSLVKAKNTKSCIIPDFVAQLTQVPCFQRFALLCVVAVQNLSEI